jgi:hypothetical protein
MPNRTEAHKDPKIDLGKLGRRFIEADFSGGDLTSDGGLALLRQLDAHLGLSRAAASALPDPRDPARTHHGLRELIAQRLYALCCGYADLNDHHTLRHDLLMQTAVGSDVALASASTLCRLENRATRAQAWALHEVLAAQFIAAHKTAPEEIVLDVDASDVPLHGSQELRQFHAYYDQHCYLPLYVFAGQHLLACVLRPSRIDGAKHAAAVLRLLITRLRKAWPQTRFIVRGDSGFCRQRLLRWCERAKVGYAIGLARNARLHAQVAAMEAQMQERFEQQDEGAKSARSKQRYISEFSYAAKSWEQERRVITRLEWGEQGANPRFVVTNLALPATELYDALYCQRGEAENRIKEAQLDLFGTRASCHRFAANQLRLLLAALAYTLMQRLRALALKGTQLERACAATIRVRLLKIGAAIVRNTRRVRVLLASGHPLRQVYAVAARRLAGLAALSP